MRGSDVHQRFAPGRECLASPGLRTEGISMEWGQEPGTNFSALGLNMLGLKFIGQKMGQLNPRYPGSSADLNYVYQQEMRYSPLKLIQAVYF